VRLAQRVAVVSRKSGQSRFSSSWRRISVSIIGLSVLITIPARQLPDFGFGYMDLSAAPRDENSGYRHPFAANTEFLATAVRLVDRRLAAFSDFPCLRRISIFDIGLA